MPGVLLRAGPGESGKSTVFKQMKLIYGLGFSDEEKAVFTHVVHNNIISSMRALLQACEDLGHKVGCTVRGCCCTHDYYICISPVPRRLRVPRAHQLVWACVC